MRVLWLPAIPIIAAIIATLLFIAQRGFGGGHGRFDFALGILSLPGILLVELFRLPTSIPDFVLVVLLPTVFNVTLWMAVAVILWLSLRRRPTI